MSNPYKEYLDIFFSTLLEYRHSTKRLNNVLKKDVETYTSEGAKYMASSSLIISDWTGLIDNGWEINFPTNIFKITSKETYGEDIDKVISRECNLIYAQSFEALERFIKNCLFLRAQTQSEFKSFIISKSKPDFILARNSFPGGEKLFRFLKKAGNISFQQFSEKNNLNIRFSALWIILSETRHSITHAQSKLETSKINRSDYHKEVFDFLFKFSKIDADNVLIELDYKRLEKLIKKLSEFAYQIFKILSIEDNYEWKVYNIESSKS